MYVYVIEVADSEFDLVFFQYCFSFGIFAFYHILEYARRRLGRRGHVHLGYNFYYSNFFSNFFLFIMFMRVLRVYVGYLLLRVYVGYLLWGCILIDAFSRTSSAKQGRLIKNYMSLFFAEIPLSPNLEQYWKKQHQIWNQRPRLRRNRLLLGRKAGGGGFPYQLQFISLRENVGTLMFVTKMFWHFVHLNTLGSDRNSKCWKRLMSILILCWFMYKYYSFYFPCFFFDYMEYQGREAI